MRVKCEMMGTHNMQGVLLMPGWNAVETEKWMQVRKHPHVINLLKEGKLIEEGLPEGAADAEDLKPGKTAADIVPDETSEQDKVDNRSAGVAEEADKLKSLNAKNAAKVVSECFVLELLEAWEKNETRDTVKKAIEKQIGILKAEPKRRSDDKPADE